MIKTRRAAWLLWGSAMLAASADAADGRACVAADYAAVFTPWSDGAVKPQVWLVPETGPARVVDLALDLPSDDIRGIACTPEAVLLRLLTSVVRVPRSADSAEALAPSSWPSRGRGTQFKLSKARIVKVGRQPGRLIIATAKGGEHVAPEEFTAVFIAEAPGRKGPVFLFSTSMITVTVDTSRALGRP